MDCKTVKNIIHNLMTKGYQITKLCNIITCMQSTLSLYGVMGIDYYDFENLYQPKIVTQTYIDNQVKKEIT